MYLHNESFRLAEFEIYLTRCRICTFSLLVMFFIYFLTDIFSYWATELIHRFQVLFEQCKNSFDLGYEFF